MNAERLPCGDCTQRVPVGALACPHCHALVHAGRLRELSEQARTLTRDGDHVAALSAWRSALELLPPGTRQHTQIREKIASLATHVDERPAEPPSKMPKIFASLGVFGLLLWKLKGFVFLAFGAAKPLLLGFTKLPTLLSMLFAVGVYWSAYGWKFAVGLVLSIYVHEIGHVVELRRFGISATSPMFIPGVGAFVRLRQYPNDAIEDARVGLAGPRWGSIAAMLTACAGFVFAAPFLLAIARVSAWLNLFNLLPIGGLDGGRGARSLGVGERRFLLLVTGVAFAFTHEWLVALLALLLLLRMATPAHPKGDRRAALEFSLLVATLAAMTKLPVPR